MPGISYGNADTAATVLGMALGRCDSLLYRGRTARANEVAGVLSNELLASSFPLPSERVRVVLKAGGKEAAGAVLDYMIDRYASLLNEGQRGVAENVLERVSECFLQDEPYPLPPERIREMVSRVNGFMPKA